MANLPARLCSNPREHALFSIGPISVFSEGLVVSAESDLRVCRRCSQRGGREFEPPAVHQPSLSLHAKIVRRSLGAGGPPQSSRELPLASAAFALKSAVAAAGAAYGWAATPHARELGELRERANFRDRVLKRLAGMNARSSGVSPIFPTGQVQTRLNPLGPSSPT